MLHSTSVVPMGRHRIGWMNALDGDRVKVGRRGKTRGSLIGDQICH